MQYFLSQGFVYLPNHWVFGVPLKKRFERAQELGNPLADAHQHLSLIHI